MAGDRKPNSWKAGALLSATLWTLCAPAQTVRHHQEKIETNSASSQTALAENAIEKKDYATAEKLLLPVVEANPKDDVAWYDLGFVYKTTERHPQAIEAYRKSIAAKPDFYESNLNLALLLAQEEQNTEGVRYMKEALRLMPATTSASAKTFNWMALGRMEEKLDANEAVEAYRKAAEFSPKETAPHLMAARLLESNKQVDAAANEYKAAIAIDSHSKNALGGLIDLYRDSGRTADAETALRQYAKVFPQDPKVHLMLGQSLLKSGDSEGAVKEFDAGLQQSPGDVGLLHEIAAMYAAQKKFALAAPRYAELVKAAPTNADYHFQYGVVLQQLHQFPEAQQQLIAALQRDPKLVEAYGELAVAANENKDYALVIKALDARSKVTPETPATFFLRATAYDNLKAYPQAADNYHKFLDASKGAFPDKEWQARHRLVAIEPEGGKKKKS